MHGNTLVHQLLFLFCDGIDVFQGFVKGNNHWVLADVLGAHRFRNHGCDFRATLTQDGESGFVFFKFLFYLVISINSLLELCLVVRKTLFVLAINRGRRQSVECGAILLAESSVLCLFLLYLGVHGSYQVIVHVD